MLNSSRTVSRRAQRSLQTLKQILHQMCSITSGVQEVISQLSKRNKHWILVIRFVRMEHEGRVYGTNIIPFVFSMNLRDNFKCRKIGPSPASPLLWIILNLFLTPWSIVDACLAALLSRWPCWPVQDKDSKLEN